MKKKTSTLSGASLATETLRDFDRICRAFHIPPDAVLQQFACRASLRKALFATTPISKAVSRLVGKLLDERNYVEQEPDRRLCGIHYIRAMIRIYRNSRLDPQTKRQKWDAIELAWHNLNNLESPREARMRGWSISISPGFNLLADFMGSSAEQLLQMFITKLVEESGDPGQPATALLIALHEKLNHPHLN